MRPRSTAEPEMEVAQADFRIARQNGKPQRKEEAESGPLLHMKSRCELFMRVILLLHRACRPCSGTLRPSSTRALMHNHQRLHTTAAGQRDIVFEDVVSKSWSASGLHTVRVTRSGIHCDFELVVLEDLDLSAPLRISIPVSSA